MTDHLLALYIAEGCGAFTSSQKWLQDVTGKDKLFCAHCHNVYESVKRIDAVVNNNERESDIDLIAVNCHGVQPISVHFIDVVGQPLIEETASLGRLLDEKGFEHGRYRVAIARTCGVMIRGSLKSHFGLCRECGRLLYSPVGVEYIVQQELPNKPLFFSDEYVYCTPEFYEQRLITAMLRGVAIRKIPIRKEPLDDLPASTKELKEFLKSSGKYK